jgi:hypothetical protein
MIEYPNLIPECNVDTVFVEVLGYKRPNHAPNINDVFKIFAKKKATEKLIGFVDNDKRKQKELFGFVLIDKINDVSLLKHPDKEHYLVVVSPAMDEFIFKLCKRLNINIPKKLPGEFEAFKSFTKKAAIRNNLDFKNLLNTVVQKYPPEIVKVKLWISKFSPYKD